MPRKSTKGPGRPAARQVKGPNGRRCGLCGKTRNLTKAECCGQWICDDEGSYALFSYARNSCARNHRRFTLCGHHFNERHAGTWQTCESCREGFATEMYVYYGTNEYNFEKLAPPPAFEPTRCGRCNGVIKLGTEEYSIGRDGYTCSNCFSFELPPPPGAARRAIIARRKGPALGRR